MKRKKLLYLILGALLISGCSQAATDQPTATSLPTPVATESPATPTTPTTEEAQLATATSESLLSDGWETHTSQRCDYAISYPSEMQADNQGTYSWLLQFKPTNPDDRVPNFVYVSVIDQDIRSINEEDVYNYDSTGAELLLNMQVGESKSLAEDLDVAPWFTYERKVDTPISGHVAQTYENLQPWEFPGGTKEIRYYLSLNGCTYLIGGYLDTTMSNQPGVITEELFNQIIATIQLIP